MRLRICGLCLASNWNCGLSRAMLATLLLSELSFGQPSIDPESLKILSALEAATVNAIAVAEESVVAIARVSRDQNPGDRGSFDPLRLRNPVLSQSPLENPDFVPKFFGSGVIISQDGFIVTCAHVVDDPRENDYFVWKDKHGFQARVVGRPAKVYAADPFSDLAVLKIDETELTPIRFGDGENLRKGRFVIALGNPDATAMDGQASASLGIVSNLKRIAPNDASHSPPLAKETVHQYGTLIQTDAKLGLGSSGGPLVNLQGEMIGLSTSLVALPGFEDSAGFAIAVNEMFRRVVDELKLGRLPEYGFLGIQPEDIALRERHRGLRGARVSLVIPGLPGAQAGLESGDLVLEVDQQPIYNRSDLFRELSLAPVAEDIELLIHRWHSGDTEPTVLKLKARLSKKYVSTSRPSFAINSPPQWRGLSVEYLTAFPPERMRSGFMGNGRNPPKIAVLSVEPNTPTWNVGLRPGFGIVSVGSQTVESPEQFRELVGQQTGQVELEFIGNAGHRETVSIPGEDPID